MFKGLYKYIATSPPLSRRPRPWTRPKTRGCPPHIAAAWLKSYETKQLQKKNSLCREGEGEEVPRQNRPRAEPSFVSNLFSLDLEKLERAGCHHSQTNFHLKIIFCNFPKSNFHHFQVRAKKLCDHCVNCGKKRIKKIVTNASQEVFTNLPYSLCPRSTRLKQRCCADFPAFPIVRERG